MGKYIAQNDSKVLRKNFYRFSLFVNSATVVLFGTCLLLINPFVQIYTTNVNDVDYYRPVFALIILFANIVYCLREPLRLIILAAGKFKETNFGAMVEAVLNILISILLISKYGLTGVAIGTLVAMIYRMGYFILFLRKSIINIDIRKFLLTVAPCIMMLVNVFMYYRMPLGINSILSFVLYGLLVVGCEFVLTGMICFVSYKLLAHD